MSQDPTRRTEKTHPRVLLGAVRDEIPPKLFVLLERIYEQVETLDVRLTHIQETLEDHEIRS